MAEKAPYGDVAYADPGYQSDKQKRYPIDTADHARAAWSYINKASNASAYSSDDLAKVKAKIRAACAKFGIEIAGDAESASEDKNEKVESKAIECRAAVNINRIERNELVFLPVGLHAITPVSGGIGKPIKVLVNADTAGAMESQRRKIEAATDKRVYFDFNHEDGRASFWPSSFVWRDSEGVVAKGEWSESGRKAVEGKDFRAFSPVFHVDDKRKDPARVVCCDKASPNMGGLVNDPAFSDLPLWAKNAGEITGASDNNKTKKDKMNEEEIAALRAKTTELEKQVDELKAKVAANEEDEPAKMKLAKAEAELRANSLEVESAELKAKTALLAEQVRKRTEDDADAAIKACIADGRILPKDYLAQKHWKLMFMADPASTKTLMAAMQRPSGLRNRVTGDSSHVEISLEDPFNVYQKLALICQDSQRTSDSATKTRCSEDFAAIYAATFKDTPKNREQRERLLGARLSVAREALVAGDITDSNLGTIAGTLVTQRTLELLKFIFPPITRFTTDFSDQPATFNQTIMTRTIAIPTVQTYSTATGWTDAVAQTTDVPVVINNHKGVPITFNEQLLASTMRRLFDEFSEAAAYALGKNLVDALYANLTDANFTNNTVSTSAAFARATVVDIGTALTLRGVPLGLGNRTMLLWPAAFGNLEKDASMIQFATNVPRPDIMTGGPTPASAFAIPIEAFDIYSAPNLPSNNANLVGFAGSKSALIIATRMPNDYTSVFPGASSGNIQTVTDPDIGMSVMQVQYTNHTLGTATSRIAFMYGTAAGQTNAGQMVKAAAGTGSAR
jgi:hypothetical protein